MNDNGRPTRLPPFPPTRAMYELLPKQWVPRPAVEFFTAVPMELGLIFFIAEDLGMITPDVCALRDQFRIPATKVLQFAFAGHTDNPYLPCNYVCNAVVYTGTHDNNTTRGWYEESPDSRRRETWRYLIRQQGSDDEVAPLLVSLA